MLPFWQTSALSLHWSLMANNSNTRAFYIFTQFDFITFFLGLYQVSGPTWMSKTWSSKHFTRNSHNREAPHKDFRCSNREGEGGWFLSSAKLFNLEVNTSNNPVKMIFTFCPSTLKRPHYLIFLFFKPSSSGVFKNPKSLLRKTTKQSDKHGFNHMINTSSHPVPRRPRR